ncbi:MAG: hypothetical protein Q8P95_05315, partial [bacterium]|nr:hypothetical protein [bacterium]
VRGFYGLRDVTLTQNSALRRQARGRARLINEVKGDAAELQAKTMPLRYLLVPRLERGKGESVHLQKRTVITADGINEIMVEPADQFETRWQQVEKKRQQASPLETPTYFAKANGHRLTPMANPARLLRELLESKDLAYREILLRPDAKEIALGVEPGENFSLAIFTTGKYGGRATPPRQRGKQEREHFAGDLEKPFREDFWYRQIPREEKEANDIDRLKNDPHSPFRAPFYDLYCLSRFLTQAKKLVGPAHQAKIRGDIKENRAMVAGGDTYEAVIVSDFPPKKEEYRLIPGFDLVEVPREKTEPTLRRKGRDEQAPATAKERITLQEFYRRLRKKLAGVPAPEERERRPPPGPTPPPQPEDPDEPEEEDPVDDE